MTCRAGNVIGCANLGRVIREGGAGHIDLDAARTLIETSCATTGGMPDEAQIWQCGCGLEQPMMAPLFSKICA